MSIGDVLLILLVVASGYIATQLPRIISLLERIAGVAHYQQQSNYDNQAKVPIVKKVEKAKEPFAGYRRPTDSRLQNLEDLSEEQQLAAIYGDKE